MPSFLWSQALTANQIGYNPLTGWQFERIPNAWGKAAIRIIVRASTTGTVKMTVTSGSTTIVQRSPVPNGGVVGNTPTIYNAPQLTFLADPDDKIAILFDEGAAGTPTVDGIIDIERAG